MPIMSHASAGEASVGSAESVAPASLHHAGILDSVGWLLSTPLSQPHAPSNGEDGVGDYIRVL